MSLLKEDAEQIVNSLDQLSQPRLINPTVRYLYQANKQLGVLAALGLTIARVDRPLRQPLIHTLASHLTKEKPIFVYTVGATLGLAEGAVKQLAAGTDLIWGLSLIVDDMIDQDSQRAGQTSAWAEFGPGFSYRSVQAGLEAVLADTELFWGVDAKQHWVESVQVGLDSVAEHRTFNLDTPLDQLEANYDHRALFHARAPFEILYNSPGLTLDSSVQGALREVNLAGQILNDIKDLIPAFRWLRPYLTDLRSGLVTVPLKLLWDRLTISDQDQLLRYFGNHQISDEAEEFVVSRMRQTGTLGVVKDLMIGLYHSSQNQYNAAVANPIFRDYFGSWVDYKLEQIGGFNDLRI